jgi:hypothetical protein
MTDSLSVDAAVGLLNDAPEEAPAEIKANEPDAVEADEPDTEDNDIEAPPEADDPDAPETASEGEGEEVEAAQPPIEPPHFWSAEAKARFAELPYELQLVVQENEKAGSKAATQRLEEATLAKKAAEAKAEVLASLAERIEAAAEQAEATFANRWAGMDQAAWLKLSRENPNQYIQLKAQHDAEMNAVQQARSAKDATSQVEHARWVSEQETLLKTIAPDLTDPVKGPANRGAVAEYLKSQGVAEQALSNVGALEVSIAWKAMQYDKGRTALKPRPAAEKAPIRPAASPSQSPQSNALANAETRFKRSGSVEDAVRLLNLKG